MRKVSDNAVIDSDLGAVSLEGDQFGDRFDVNASVAGIPPVKRSNSS